MDWIYALGSILSVVAAILAWAAKLQWSREFAAAKDETIKAKDAHIEALKDLTPMKIREYFISVKQQLEEYNDKLGVQLDEARVRIKDLEHIIQEKDREQSELYFTLLKGNLAELDKIRKAGLHKFLSDFDAFAVTDDGVSLIEFKTIKPHQLKTNDSGSTTK